MDIIELNARLPYGSDFAALRQSKSIYVDKTYQIYQLALDDEPKQLTRPRRFGKSTIVSTLKELFTHGVKPYIDENGVEHESCFKGLAIEKLWKDEKTYKVIHIDFSNLVYDINYFLEFERPDLKPKDGQITGSFLAAYFNYVVGQYLIEYAPSIGISNFSCASKNFCDVFKKIIVELGTNNVVLLIDEYDYPLTHKPSEAQLDPEEYKLYIGYITESFRNFYSIIKANCKYFRKVFITGVTRYKDVSMFTLGNTIKDISKELQFGTIVGFTREEIKKYFPEHLKYSVAQIENKDVTSVTEIEVESLLDKMAIWYDGYSFDECVQSHVFSTISVISFFDNIMSKTRFQNYWYDLGGTPSILVNNFQKIIDNDINSVFEANAEFKVREDKFSNPTSFADMDPKVLLYQTGYLTLAKPIGNQVALKFPNYEIRSSFAKLQANYWFGENQKIIESNLNYKIKALSFECPLEEIVNYFNIIENAVPFGKNYFDKECHVVNPIYTYLYYRGFNVSIESSTVLGRSDLRIDFDNNKTLIFEFKFHRSNDKVSVKTHLENALQQIKDKRYLDIPDREVKGYALVFDKDTCKFEAFAEI